MSHLGLQFGQVVETLQIVCRECVAQDILCPVFEARGNPQALSFAYPVFRADLSIPIFDFSEPMPQGRANVDMPCASRFAVSVANHNYALVKVNILPSQPRDFLRANPRPKHNSDSSGTIAMVFA